MLLRAAHCKACSDCQCLVEIKKKQLAHINDEILTEHLERTAVNKQESEYSIEMSDMNVDCSC